MLWLGAGWQRDIHELMGLDAPAGYTSIGIVVLAVLVFALFVGIGRGDPVARPRGSSGCSAASSRGASPGRSGSSWSRPW